ncbi:hypothetical protein RFI_03893 [Reticulomyxa filosa]|uniref:Uncharacterized protein n=1 Tax=Reticulomyxa filosa TaxID=46433 RepID=X6P3T5_RETFI|nr:hypothetical protein RFI_03893 [Reticulomyxa filosa]|eukprot:ETO33210.1 hypothetical protein RFI_03893 [Reticulomyxa filosa]
MFHNFQYFFLLFLKTGKKTDYNFLKRFSKGFLLFPWCLSFFFLRIFFHLFIIVYLLSLFWLTNVLEKFVFYFFFLSFFVLERKKNVCLDKKMKNGNVAEKVTNKAAIILETKAFEFLSAKDVAKTLALVCREYCHRIKGNTNLTMKLISYDFGEIFDKYDGLKKQLLSHEINSLQCIRLLYSQFETLHDLKVPNYNLASVLNAPLTKHSHLATKETTEVESESADKENMSFVLNKPRATNQKTAEVAATQWDFTHLIGLKTSGCILHWLSYVQKLYSVSGQCGIPCELTCDSNGIVQIQPVDCSKYSSSDDIADDSEKTFVDEDEVIAKSQKKIVLSCALDLWNLCWKKGFTSKELAKLQQGLTLFEFRRW